MEERLEARLKDVLGDVSDEKVRALVRERLKTVLKELVERVDHLTLIRRWLFHERSSEEPETTWARKFSRSEQVNAAQVIDG